MGFIWNSIEYQGWGNNLLTFSTIGIAFFALLETWALWKQAHTLFLRRSAEAVSLPWFAYMGSYFCASIFYGVAINSAAVVGNCIILGVFHLPVIVALLKFGESSRAEKLQAAAFLLMVPALALLPWKGALFLAFSLGTIYSVATQPLKMLRERSAGDLELPLVVIYFCSCSFWTLYAFMTWTPELMILNPPVLFFLGLTWYLHRKYHADKPVIA